MVGGIFVQICREYIVSSIQTSLLPQTFPYTKLTWLQFVSAHGSFHIYQFNGTRRLGLVSLSPISPLFS
jgi:hypothetical protein